MKSIIYLWSKVFKKVRGSAIKNSDIHVTSKIEAGSLIVDSFMARHSFCGYDCEISNCKIGSFTSIANGVIIGGGMHPINWVSTSPVFYEGRDSVKAKFSTHKRESVKQTIVGHDVWIGQNSLIKQGVEIGTGAVIGMGSIVTKNVEPYSIVAGNPAKLIKMRFDKQTIQQLLVSQWWNISDTELLRIGKYIKKPEIFLKEVKDEKITDNL